MLGLSRIDIFVARNQRRTILTGILSHQTVVQARAEITGPSVSPAAMIPVNNCIRFIILPPFFKITLAFLILTLINQGCQIDKIILIRII